MLTRFDDGISVVDLGARKRGRARRDVQPRAGERDGGPASSSTTRRHTSALGDQACASCHIGGDFDGLAWDLGNPGNIPLPITTTRRDRDRPSTRSPKPVIAALLGPRRPRVRSAAYHAGQGADDDAEPARPRQPRRRCTGAATATAPSSRPGVPFLDASGNPVVSAQPNSGIFDEVNAFKSFNVAFPGLVGNAAELSDADMTAFANFTLADHLPAEPDPQPRQLAHRRRRQAGDAFYFNKPSTAASCPIDRFHDCNGCHVLDRTATRGLTAHPGFFGTDGRLSFEGETQIFKVPHLRNAYQKVGMYASSLDSVHAVRVRHPAAQPAGSPGRPRLRLPPRRQRRRRSRSSSRAFVFIQTTVPVAFDGPARSRRTPTASRSSTIRPTRSNPASGISSHGLELRQRARRRSSSRSTRTSSPIVGQQITLTGDDASATAARIALLEAQATAGTDRPRRPRDLPRGRDTGFVVLQRRAGSADVSCASAAHDAQLQCARRLQRRSRSPRCRPARAGASASTATATATPTATSWRSGPTRPTPTATRRSSLEARPGSRLARPALSSGLDARPPPHQRRSRRHSPQRARDVRTPTPCAPREECLAAGRRRHHRAPARGPAPHRRRRRRAAARPVRGAPRARSTSRWPPPTRWSPSRRGVKPEVCTLVPERRQERTTEGGLDVAAGGEALARRVKALLGAGIKVSLFIAAEADAHRARRGRWGPRRSSFTPASTPTAGQGSWSDWRRARSGRTPWAWRSPPGTG